LRWQCRLRQSRARRDAQNRCREPVAATWHGHDDVLPAVADGLTNLAHAMRQYLVGHDHIRPDCLYQLLFGYQTVSVLSEVVQDLDSLRTQLNVAIRRSQRVAREIQRKSLELQHIAARAEVVPCQGSLATTCNVSRLQPLSRNYTVLSGLGVRAT